MKRLTIIFSLVLIGITFAGCSKDEVNVLAVIPENVTFNASGGSRSITIRTDASSWSIANTASDWLNVSATSGNTEEATITLSITTRSLEARTATLTISAGDARPAQVIISQLASQFLYTFTTDLSALEFIRAGETKLLQIETTSPQWSLSADADWLQFDNNTGLDGSKTISVTALENPGVIRTTTISITGDQSQTAQVQVEQEGDLYPNYNTSPIDPDETGMASNAVELAAKIKLGWNLGNTLDATGGETSWGNPMATQALIDFVKASGFNAIRIPAHWDYYANASTAKIQDAWLARVKEVVQYCINSDLYVILNIHHGAFLQDHINTQDQASVNAKQKAFWEQIATTMRDFDERVMFASSNEPPADNATQMSVLLSYHQTFVNAVRSTGGRNSYRVLVIQGPSTDIDKTSALMNTMPVDQIAGRMMAEVHYYSPWQFCGLEEDADWGKMSYYWGNGYHSATDPERNASSEEDYVIAQFQKVKTKFVDQGIPVVLGEFGAIRRTEYLTGDALTLHLASRAYYNKFVTQQAIAHGLMPFYWDNGYLSHHQFGIFDRVNNTVGDQQVLDALVEGAQ
jgi:endoglucanase